MREPAGRLAELDPDAGAALQVIAYFDRLMEGRVGLEALVRGAAVLSGCPARLLDERRGVRIRVEPDGRRADPGGPAAAELTVRHSTLQERLVQAEHILGWDVHSPQGRLRLQLALTVRKLRRTEMAEPAPEGFSGGARQ